MAEKVKGLPPGFALDVPAKAGKPLQWGNYLDEEVSAATPSKVVQMDRQGAPAQRETAQRQATERHEPEGAGEEPSPAETRARRGQASRSVRIVDRVRSRAEVTPERPARAPARKSSIPRPKRKQINMTPETLDRFGDLLDLFRDRSVQKDLHASELMDALVCSAADAADSLELSRLPARGRWGDPSALAFRQALRALVADAIVRHRKGAARPRVQGAQASEEMPAVETNQEPEASIDGSAVVAPGEGSETS